MSTIVDGEAVPFEGFIYRSPRLRQYLPVVCDVLDPWGKGVESTTGATRIQVRITWPWACPLCLPCTPTPCIRLPESAMSALPDPTFNTRLNERAYHPSMRAAVVAAYESGVVVRVFPALIRIEDLADAVAWLKDLSGVKVESCTTCALMGIPCILHNGSSYRCLYCFLKNGDACSHQTGEYLDDRWILPRN